MLSGDRAGIAGLALLGRRQFAKTDSRVVIGFMNDMDNAAKFFQCQLKHVSASRRLTQSVLPRLHRVADIKRYPPGKGRPRPFHGKGNVQRMSDISVSSAEESNGVEL